MGGEELAYSLLSLALLVGLLFYLWAEAGARRKDREAIAARYRQLALLAEKKKRLDEKAEREVAMAFAQISLALGASSRQGGADVPEAPVEGGGPAKRRIIVRKGTGKCSS